MTEQREPGWYYVRIWKDGGMLPRFFHHSSEGEDVWLGVGKQPEEVGHRIPTNDELKALYAVVEDASQLWEALETMYKEQDSGIHHSGPRDKFESFLDHVVCEAKDIFARLREQK